MNFLHLSLLAGLGAMAIPVALHLLSRRTPKQIPFPALRFVKQTVVQQRGSWQLRHFLLLCLRVGMFGAMAIALARPRVHSAMMTTAVGLSLLVAGAVFASLVALIALVTRRGTSVWIPATVIAVAMWLTAGVWTTVSITAGPVVPSSDQSAPVAAAIIIDNGPSLDYRAENEKRFVAAKKMATWILGKLPLDSRVGVLTNAPLGALSLDPTTAKSQIDLLQPQASHIDLVARLRTAIDLVLASDLERKEVYVVTDLMRSSWSAGDTSLPSLLKEHSREVLVQVIDVGADKPANWRLSDLSMDNETIPEGGDARWEVSVHRSPQIAGASVTVELLQEESGVPILRDDSLKTPPTRVVDRQIVDLTTSNDARVTLTARGLTPGTHNFQVRLNVADPLELDNVRYATVVCSSQQSTLVVADNADTSRLLRLALSPSLAAEAFDPKPQTASPNSSKPGSPSTPASGGNGDAQRVRSNQLAQVDLDRYGVVYLNDPPSLPPSVVGTLEKFVDQGGGLFIALGPSLGNPQELENAAILKLLPGRPARIGRRPIEDSSLFLIPVSTTHPLFHIFDTAAAEVPWNLFPLHRVWEFDNVAQRAQVLMTTSDRGLPGLILEQRGAGQIMTLVTPLPSDSGADSWNDLFAGADPWPAFGLVIGSARLLSGQAQARYNYTAGEAVALPNDTRQFPTNYMLFSPNGERRNVQAENSLLVIGNPEQAGAYRLRGLQGSSVTRGVSVNTSAADTLLERMEPKELDTMLGADNYRLARRQEEVESSVGQARYGRELFPLLMACIAGLFLAEQAMSNRFYRMQFMPAKART